MSETVKKTKAFNHTVVRYEGHILDILGAIKTERVTGKLTVDIQQGGVVNVELDTREKIFIDKSSE